MAAEVIKFPEKEIIIRCRHCKSNSFYIILNSLHPDDIKMFECAVCSKVWMFDGAKRYSKRQNTWVDDRFE